MNITNLPVHPMVNDDGQLHPSWRIWFNQITNQLQTFLSDEKYKLPQQPVKTGTSISDLNVIESEGGILYDNQAKTGKINTEDGYSTNPPNTTYSFKTVVTYEEATSAQIAAIPSGQRNGRIIFNTDTSDTVLGTNDGFITL